MRTARARQRVRASARAHSHTGTHTQYSGAGKGKARPTVLVIKCGAIDRGASIADFSQYPGEVGA